MVFQEKNTLDIKNQIINSYMDLHSSGKKKGIYALMQAGLGMLSKDDDVKDVLIQIESRVGKDVLEQETRAMIEQYGISKYPMFSPKYFDVV